jgi:hypothetical protein
VIVPWPASGQVQMRTSGFQPEQTIVYRMVWASAMDASKFGSVTVAEVPGCAVMGHHLQAWVNGVLRWSGDPSDTGPQFGISNAPTPGTPSQIMMNHGETLDVYITNAAKPPFTSCSDVLVDFRLPDRY